MKRIISTRIEPGELTEVRGEVYLSATWDTTIPCTWQCAMAAGGACNGYCFRWDNTEEVVFRHVLPAALVKADTEVVATPDLIGDFSTSGMTKQERAKKLYYYNVVKKARESLPRRPYGSGTVTYQARGLLATIIIDGDRFARGFQAYDEAAAWLDEMFAKKKAVETINRLKRKK